MDIEDAIATIDAVLGSQGLNDLEIQVLRQVWDGEKYADIAESLGYDANYIKDLGAKIWKQLSQSLNEKVTKSNVQSVLRRHRSLAEQPTDQTQSGGGTPVVLLPDRGETIDTSHFIGRQSSLELLESWCQDPSCRFVTLVGTPGLGKTILAARLVEKVTPHFKTVIWRSLKTPLPLPQLLQDLLTTFQTQLPTTSSTEVQIDALIQALAHHRCLLVLDHADSLIEPGSMAGDFRSGYEDYRNLCQLLSSTRHRSCILVVCREQPKAWGLSAGETMRSHVLPPLSAIETEELLQAKGQFQGKPNDWETLTQQYNGNPLALQIVSTTILDFFQGNVSEFLAEGQVVFAGLSAFLQQQWQPLSAIEQWVLFYLAICQDPVPFKTIKSDLLDASLQRRLTDILSALHRRTLLERNTQDGVVTFGLQSAVFEYATVRLVETLATELVQSPIDLLHQLPLLKINHQDYIQHNQRQQLLQPLLEQLKDLLPRTVDLPQYLQGLLTQLQDTPPSYAAGNLVNLLMQNGCSLMGLDLSGLPLWEVCFATSMLHQVNLSNTDLSRTGFANAFGGVTCTCLAADEARFVTGHQNGSVLIWDAHQGQQLQSLTGHKSWIWGLDWSPNGDNILSVSEDHRLRVWDAETGNCLHVLEGHCDRIWRVICPNNEIAITSSNDQTLKVWDFINGKCLRTLASETDVVALAVNEPEQLVFCGGPDGTLQCWHWVTGEHLETWSSQQGGIWAIAYCQSSRTLYSAGDTGVIEVWQRDDTSSVETLGQLRGRIWSLALSPCDRYLVAGGDSGQLTRWDLQAGKIDQSLGGYEGRISAIDYGTSGNTVITTSEDQTVRLWNITNGQPLLSIRSYSNWACEVTFASVQAEKDLVASAHSDGNLYLWDIKKGKHAQTLQGHQRSVWTVAASPSGTQIVSGSDEGTLRIWEVASGQCTMRLQGHQSRIWCVAWSPDGTTIASGSGDRTLKLWDANSGDCLSTLTGHQSRIWSVAFSPNGQWIATGSGDRTLKIWDPQTGTCAATLEGHQSLVLSSAFHPQQSMLASVAGDGTCKLWDLETFTCQNTIPVPTKMNWSLAWSPDGHRLAIGGNDGQIRLWNQTQQNWDPVLSGHTECVWSVAFHADGQTVCSGSQDGSTRLWDLQTRECRSVLEPPKLYEGLNIMDAQGISPAQIATLQALGAKSYA